MIRWALVLCAFGCADVALSEEAQEIYGGAATSIAQVPWQVALTYRTGELRCGASIVNRSWIMTAQHCVDGISGTDDLPPPRGDANFKVVAGITQLSAQVNGQHRSVDAIAKYPSYVVTPSGPVDDIALLHLTTPLELGGPSARPVPRVTPIIANTGATGAGTPAKLSGWGMIEGGTYPDQLRTVTLAIGAPAPQPTQLLAGGSGLDACFGDSGGPLVVDHGSAKHQAGIVSYGSGCGAGGAYTRVSAYADWISAVSSSSVHEKKSQAGLSGALNSFTNRMSISVPPNARTLSVIMSNLGPASNATLYVRYGTWATTSQYDCRVGIPGSDESCTFDAPASGTWYVSMLGVSAYSGLALDTVVLMPAKSDIMWRCQGAGCGGAAAGSIVLWKDGGTAGGESLGQLGSEWQPAGVGDFDGNGKKDFLWHSVNGSNVIWYDGRAPGVWISSAPAGWRVAGIGDFNGDGKSDLLWRSTGGSNAIWTDTVGPGYWIAPLGTDWDVAGVGDFDGNGKSDILWRSVNGSNVIWYEGVAPGVWIGDLAGSWQLGGIGDFDGDGRSDLLWRSTAGSNVIWYSAIAPGVWISPLDGAWSIAGVDDFSGNGRADILWRRSTNENAYWTDGDAAATQFLSSMPQGWQVLGIGNFR